MCGWTGKFRGLCITDESQWVFWRLYSVVGGEWRLWSFFAFCQAITLLSEPSFISHTSLNITFASCAFCLWPSLTDGSGFKLCLSYWFSLSQYCICVSIHFFLHTSGFSVCIFMHTSTYVWWGQTSVPPCHNPHPCPVAQIKSRLWSTP